MDGYGVPRKPVGSKWIFKPNLNEDGNVAQYTTRLVAQGFSQMFCTDFNEIIAPILRQVTFRALLTIASANIMLMKYADVKTFYFDGPEDRFIWAG